MKITLVYDNEIYKKGLTSDHGFSCLIEMEYHKSIKDRLAKVKDLSVQLSSSEYQQLMKVLALEPVYRVALQMVKE